MIKGIKTPEIGREWQYETYNAGQRIPIGDSRYIAEHSVRYRRNGENLQRMEVQHPTVEMKFGEQVLAHAAIKEFEERYSEWEIYIERGWDSDKGLPLEPRLKIVGWVDTSSPQEQALYEEFKSGHFELNPS